MYMLGLARVEVYICHSKCDVSGQRRCLHNSEVNR
jgi:hypothetical protein